MRMFPIIIAAAVIATASPAFSASDLDIRIADHNQYCSLTSAKEINGTPDIDERESDTHYTFSVTDHIQCVFTVQYGSVINFSCVCLSDSEADEFLAQCVTGCYTLCGPEAASGCYSPILYRFLLARGGQEKENDLSIPGFAFSLGKASFGYYFVLAKGD